LQTSLCSTAHGVSIQNSSGILMSVMGLNPTQCTNAGISRSNSGSLPSVDQGAPCS
jgi:hypothetical protein